MEVNDVVKLINGCLFNFRYFKETDCSRCFVINPKQDIDFQHYESILYARDWSLVGELEFQIRIVTITVLIYNSCDDLLEHFYRGWKDVQHFHFF